MRVKLANTAIADFAEITEYLLDHAPRSAMFVIGRLEAAIDVLGGHPRAGRKGRAWAGRQFAVAQTPYILYYSIRRSAVWIDRIIHGARKWPLSPDEDE